MAFSTVGTPDYIAPEVLLKKGYGLECDWFVDILFHLLELHLFILCFGSFPIFVDTTGCAWIFISFALTWFNYVEIVIFVVIVLIG